MALVTVLVSEHRGEVEEVDFASAVDAVAAAVARQRDAPRRIGVHVGERRQDALTEASDLCAQATVGQILVSALVRDLVAPRRGQLFRDAGGAAEVIWEPAAAEASASLPPPLRIAAASPFVARAAELETILQTWKDVGGGERRAVLVGGAAGMGKTRLAAEAAVHATAGDRGATVLYGRCEEELGVPYQPFVEALNAYLRDAPQALVDAHVAAHGAALARLVPALAARSGGAAPARSDPAAERYLMFEAVVDILNRAAAERPLLLVLDDLHWAIKPTVLLLRHILRAEVVAPVLVVGTYRDNELDRFSPLTDALAELRRGADVERVMLRGLDRDGVAALVAAQAGHDLDERALIFVEALHDETDGNPFYVAEVLNHLADSGVLYQEGGRWTAAPDADVRQLGLPESVRDVVGRRVGRLSDEATRALTVGAVIGPTFGIELLEAIPDAADDADSLLDALDEAEAAGLIQGGDRGVYSFDHALVRQTLLSGMTSARKARLHRRIGEAIEARPDAAQHVDALAYHFGEAVGGADIAKAVDYAIAAATEALEQLAHEAAVARVDRGLHALELQGAPDHRRAADLWLLRAGALQDGPGEDPDGVVDALAHAAAAARAAHDDERLVRAAELMAEETVFGAGRAPAVPLCEELLGALGTDRPDLRARVLGSLVYARATMETATPELAQQAADAAAAGWAVGDALTRSRALVAQGVVLLAGADVDALHTVGTELVDVASDRPEVWILSWGHRFVGQASLQRGDMAGFRAAHGELTRLGDERRHTTAAGWAAAWDGMQAMLDGRLDDVEQHTTAILERGGTHPNYTNAFTAQLFYLRRAQGRLAEIQPALTEAVEANPGIVGFRVALATTCADLGDFDGARRHFDLAAADNFASVPRDLAWSGALGLLTDVCVALGDGDRAPELTALLAPFGGQLIVAATGVACPGAVDRYLGRLAALSGRAAEARRLYEQALALEGRIGARPLVAVTEALLASG